MRRAVQQINITYQCVQNVLFTSLGLQMAARSRQSLRSVTLPLLRSVMVCEKALYNVSAVRERQLLYRIGQPAIIFCNDLHNFVEFTTEVLTKPSYLH